MDDDDLERRLRDILRSRRLNVEPSPDALNHIHARVARQQQRRMAASSLATLAIVGAVVAAAVVRPHAHAVIGADQQQISASSITASVTPPASSAPPSGIVRPSPRNLIASFAPPTPTVSPGLPLMSGSDAANAPTTFNPSSVSAISSDEFWVFGYSLTTFADGTTWQATLAHTTDGGKAFTVAHPDLPVAMPTMRPPVGARFVSDVRFGDSTHGWAYGNALYETDDGGESWSPITQVPGDIVDLATVHGSVWAVTQTTTTRDSTNYAVYEANFSATTATGTWSKVALPLTPNQPPSIAVQGGTAYVLASAGTDDHLLRLTADGAITDAPGPCTFGLPAKLSFGGSANVLWATCATGHMATVYVSSDAGALWRHVPTGGSNAIVVGAITADTAILADNVGDPLVLLKADGSHASVSVPDPTVSASFIGFTTAKAGFAIVRTRTDSQLWHTTDGGAHWSVVGVQQ